MEAIAEEGESGYRREMSRPWGPLRREQDTEMPVRSGSEPPASALLSTARCISLTKSISW